MLRLGKLAVCSCGGGAEQNVHDCRISPTRTSSLVDLTTTTSDMRPKTRQLSTLAQLSMEPTRKREGSKVVQTSELALQKRNSGGSISVVPETITERRREFLMSPKDRPANAECQEDHVGTAENIDSTNTSISIDSRSRLTTNNLPNDAAHVMSHDGLHDFLVSDLTAWFRQMFINIYEDDINEDPNPNLFHAYNSGNIRLDNNIQNNQTEPRRLREQTIDSPLNLLVQALPYSRCHSTNIDSRDGLPPPPQTSRRKPNPSYKSNRQSSESGSETPSHSVEEDHSNRAETFPLKLHKLLADLEAREGGQEIASFLPNGRAFRVYKPQAFEAIMKDYFNMKMFPSFQRQLLLYRFKRIKKGKDKGAYFHDLFQKGNPLMSTYMRPMKTLRRSQTDEKKSQPASGKLKRAPVPV